MIEYVSKWDDSLSWCPSQLKRNFIDPITGKINELYCRWRWSDPWIIHILMPDWTGDWILLGEGYTEWSPIDEVHSFAEKLLTEYYMKKING